MLKDSTTDYRTQLRARGICVIIPTYNNGGTISHVISDTLSYCQDLIVVNDGSTDETENILKDIHGITVISYIPNRGKGYALRMGFLKALEMGFSYAITLDSDGQHYPSDIPLFLKANQQHPSALIVGKRKLDGVDRSWGSKFANKFANFWFYIQTGQYLPDTQTGYRLYPLKKLKALALLTSRYEAELALLVLTAWHGRELISIPINVYYPPREKRVSHFRSGRDFFRISVLNTILCVLAVVYGLPLRVKRSATKILRTFYSLLFFIFFSWFVITPLVFLYIKIGKMSEHKRANLHRIIYYSARFIMLKHGIPGTQFCYRVADDVSFDKPSVIICNHQSHLDLMCQLIFSSKIVFLTNDWVWNNPFYGFLIRNAEYYHVAEGIDSLLPKLKSLVERGYSIAIYPEGTRSADCKIGRFHQGAFYIAKQLKLDILPMYLYGTGKILPKKTYMLRKGQLFIEVGSPFQRKMLEAMGDTMQQASCLRKEYIRKFKDISNEIEKNA